MFYSRSRVTLALSLSGLLLLAFGVQAEGPSTNAQQKVDLSKTDLFSQPVKPNPLQTDPNVVVVRVNGEDITRGQIMKLVDSVVSRYAGKIPAEQLDQIKKNLYEKAKESVITDTLVRQAAEKAGITVSEKEIQEKIDAIKQRIEQQGGTLEEALKKTGSSLESLKKRIRQELLTRKLFEQITADVPEATEEEAKKFYDENPDKFKRPETVSARHILIKVNPDDSDEVKAEKKAKLEKIRKEIIDGKISFEEAAKKYSDCPSKARGGDLGTFTHGRMVKEFEDAAFSQEVGEIGDVIETQYGYHIIEVTAHKPAGTVSFEKAKDQILRFLTNRKKNEKVKEFLKKLKDEAKIEQVAP